MKAKTLIISFIIFLFSSWPIVKAQDDPIKWGVILPEDINMTVYSPDPDASAVVLCDYGTASVAPRVEYTKITRIKILKEAGLEYAKVEIPYRSYEEYDYFSKIKAHTINVTVNGTSVKTKFTTSKISDIEIDKQASKKSYYFFGC